MYYVDAHTHRLVTDDEVVSLVNIENRSDLPLRDERHVLSYGIHPWYADKEPDEEVLDTVSVIGEIGLDKVKGPSMERQKQVFKRQLYVAKRRQVPVVIHCVRSWQEVCSILSEIGLTMPLLFHGYSSSPQMADDLLAHYNAYFSFSTREMTRKKSVEVMKHIPITRLLIETDDSEESSVRQLYAKVAEILNIQEEELKRVCWENFETFIIKSTQPFDK